MPPQSPDTSPEATRAPDAAPRVSIIIPAYNYARYLPMTLDSALAVTGPPREVLVIDDGSTDETATVAGGYGDRIRYIHQDNQGLSAARNTGIREARGEFLVFLDADDLLEPEMIERSLAALEAKGEDFALVAHLSDRIDGEGNPIPSPYRFPAQDVEITLLDLLVMNRFSPTVLVRKSVFTEVGDFDTALRASEDRDMWIRIARRHRIWRLHAPLSLSRKHGANMSAQVERQARCIRQVHRKAKKEDDFRGWRRFYWMKIRAFFRAQRAMMRGSTAPLRSIIDLLISMALWPWFSDNRALGQGPLFRIRLIGWILRGAK